MKLTKKILAGSLIGIVALGAYALERNGKEFKQYQMAKAIRIQTLVPIALERGDYDTACKAQKAVALSIAKAEAPKDVLRQASNLHAQICNMAWNRDWESTFIPASY